MTTVSHSINIHEREKQWYWNANLTINGATRQSAGIAPTMEDALNRAEHWVFQATQEERAKTPPSRKKAC